jgi:hypothetical protein
MSRIHVQYISKCSTVMHRMTTDSVGRCFEPAFGQPCLSLLLNAFAQRCITGKQQRAAHRYLYCVTSSSSGSQSHVRKIREKCDANTQTISTQCAARLAVIQVAPREDSDVVEPRLSFALDRVETYSEFPKIDRAFHFQRTSFGSSVCACAVQHNGNRGGAATSACIPCSR